MTFRIRLEEASLMATVMGELLGAAADAICAKPRSWMLPSPAAPVAGAIDFGSKSFHTLGMVVHLESDQEEFLLQRVRSGRFATVDEAVREAVGLLTKQETGSEGRRAHGRKSLAQLFAESPFKGTDMDFVRDNTPLRPVDF